MLLDMLLPRERRPVRTLRHQETLAPSSTNRHSSSSDKASSAPSAGGAWPRRHSSSSLDPPTAGGLQAPGRRRRGVGVPRPHHDRHDPHPADQRRDPARPLRPTTPPAPTRALALGPPLAAAVPGHPRAGPPCPNDQATEAPGTPATGGRPRPATPPPRSTTRLSQDQKWLGASRRRCASPAPAHPPGRRRCSLRPTGSARIPSSSTAAWRRKRPLPEWPWPVRRAGPARPRTSSSLPEPATCARRSQLGQRPRLLPVGREPGHGTRVWCSICEFPEQCRRLRADPAQGEARRRIAGTGLALQRGP